MNKLDFLCLGAQKAGTTTLHDILCKHPDICLPKEKEILFFDVNEYFSKGLTYYLAFYEEFQAKCLVGNISPNLQLDNRSIDRIIDSFGNKIKIIFIMRDPVYRAYSHYLMSLKRGYEDLSFLDAIEMERSRIENPKYHHGYVTRELGHFEKNHQGYIYRGRYSRSLEYLFKTFPKENIKILYFEDLLSNRDKFIVDVLKFLNVSPAVELDISRKSNTASAPKNLMIRDFINKPNFVKKFVKNLLGPTFRRNIKMKLNKYNSRELSAIEKKLDLESYHFVYDTYFKSEINTVEKILGVSLSDKWTYRP
ncbi:sulfotransferase family protein [Algoriphagus halophytocola]|uniref:Sulfotransferase domain-containing protein n=1 Tax=Algoriphagus halophytocola TaxID=2991499 RepID=A0ABY6MMF8_9BACT|nr:sulfotransferase [Algoriphagus sp. TR-M5]UZD23866.1 sulfotransferase domain-containing protein [Algoriphagus sp. TR-M5]